MLSSLNDLPPPPSGKTGWPWTEGTTPHSERMPNGNPWPRLSIVTPSYNQGRFIEETIRSVVLQGYPDIEYFIMDGGSTDETVEIIKKYEPWLAGWRSAPDAGQSEAINQGWDRATGTIVSWLNSDDAYCPGALISAARVVERDPAVGLVYGQVTVVDEEGNSTGQLGRAFDLEELFHGRNPVAQPSSFMRADALATVGGLDPSLHYAMDYDLWMRIGCKYPVQFVDEVWTRFRVYPESKTGGGRMPFLEDVHGVLERTLDSSSVPGWLASNRGRYLAGSLLRIGLAHLGQGRAGPARAAAIGAIRKDVEVLRSARGRADVLRCLVGPRIARRARKLRMLNRS